MIKLLPLLVILTVASFIKPIKANELAAIKACAKIAKDDARLTCFDQLAEQLLSTELSPLAEPLSTQKTQRQQTKSIEQFGQEHIKSSNEHELSVDFTIKLLSKNAKKRWVITFENDQVWQQKDSEYLSLSIGDEVQLSKGALGAIYLQKAGSNRKIKVRRQK